jgi:hypothetical protein
MICVAAHQGFAAPRQVAFRHFPDVILSERHRVGRGLAPNRYVVRSAASMTRRLIGRCASDLGDRGTQ